MMASLPVFKDYDFEGEKLSSASESAFGDIYVGESRSSKEKVIIKCVKTNNMALEEIVVLRSLGKHNNIIEFFEYQVHNGWIWMVLEYADLGDLQQYFTPSKLPDIDEMIDIIYQSAKGLHFLHTRPMPVIHRDIKPANILLKSGPRGLCVKLTDFGSSKMGKEEHNYSDWRLTSDVGTSLYKAPEFFESYRSYTVAVDVFSLGLVMEALFHLGPCRVKSPYQKFLPATATREKRDHFEPIGKQMHERKKSILIVNRDPNDTRKFKKCKTIITGMTAYVQRYSLEEVMSTLECTRVMGVLLSCCGLNGQQLGSRTEEAAPYNNTSQSCHPSTVAESNTDPGYDITRNLEKQDETSNPLLASTNDAVNTMSLTLTTAKEVTESSRTEKPKAETNRSLEPTPCQTDASVIIVAIDIGSAFSGFAFSFDDDVDNIIVNRDWLNTENATSSLKAPSCFLMHNEKTSVVDFGYSALLKYTKYPDYAKNYRLYYDFKKGLVSEETKAIMSIDNKEIAKGCLIEEIFRYFTLQLKQQCKKNFKNTNTTWVVPVQAKLSWKTETMFDNAAKKVGINNVVHYPTESESAGLYCQNYELRTFNEGCFSTYTLPIGSVYFIVDFGGNVSITIHEKTGKYTNKDIRVDEHEPFFLENDFEATLHKKLGNVFKEGFIETYKQEYPKEWVEMIIEFESKKRSYTQTQSQTIDVTCFATFAEHVKAKKHQTVRTYLSKHTNAGIILNDGKFQIECGKMFGGIMDKSILYLKEVFENDKLKDVGHIFVVGGLCSSLAPMIRDAFPKKKVIEPNDAIACVAKGAVVFGQSKVDLDTRC